MVRRTISALLIAALFCVAGCSDDGPATYPVTGTVQLKDGTVVETGIVEFTTSDGMYTARGDIDKIGRFSLSTFSEDDGAVAGRHKAVVVQLISTEDLPLHEHDHGPTVDPKFGHYERSGLGYTVSADGENDFTVVVEAVELPESKE